MSERKKILFVCLGNICRSPMAEGIFRQMAREMDLNLEFDSCGTGGWHAGEPPDLRAQECMMRRGKDISDLRARQFERSDFERFDHILTMDTSNYEDVQRLASNHEHRARVTLILEANYPGQNMSVPDPYYGGGEGFDKVYSLLYRSAQTILNQFKE